MVTDMGVEVREAGFGHLLGFDGMPASMKGVVSVDVQLGDGESRQEDFYVIEEAAHPIVGFPYLQAIDATIQCGERKIQRRGWNAVFCSEIVFLDTIGAEGTQGNA